MQRTVEVQGEDATAIAVPARRDVRAKEPRTTSRRDVVASYLHEIGRVPLLTAELEVRCAQRIELGRKAAANLEQWRRDELLAKVSPNERRHVAALVEDGREARDLLIQANLRLVVSIAKRYHHCSMTFHDLIQEGNLGLMKAVERFDYRKGFRFSTYATWWIRQAITRALGNQARTIRVPSYMLESFNHLVRVQRQLAQELGGEPSMDQVAAQADVPIERVREIYWLCQETISLEQPIGSADSRCLGDTIADPRLGDVGETATRGLLREALEKALAGLSEREQEIVRLRFGLEDGQARTLEEIGKIFGVTRARMEHIEAKVLTKLRQSTLSQPLGEYLETRAIDI